MISPVPLLRQELSFIPKVSNDVGACRLKRHRGWPIGNRSKPIAYASWVVTFLMLVLHPIPSHPIPSPAGEAPPGTPKKSFSALSCQPKPIMSKTVQTVLTTSRPLAGPRSRLQQAGTCNVRVRPKGDQCISQPPLTRVPYPLG